MANVVNTQVLLDGPRNVVVKVEGILDTSDLGVTVIVDPANYTGMDNTGGVKAAALLVNSIQHTVEDGLECRLSWGGATPAPLGQFTGQGTLDACAFGGLKANSITPNGTIRLATEGWTAGAKSFTLVLSMTKQGRIL